MQYNEAKNKVVLPVLFQLLIAEKAKKVNTYDSGLLAATSLDAYNDASFIKIRETAGGVAGTYEQYLDAISNLEAWNVLCEKVLNETYDYDSMYILAKNYLDKLLSEDQTKLIWQNRLSLIL